MDNYEWVYKFLREHWLGIQQVLLVKLSNRSSIDPFQGQGREGLEEDLRWPTNRGNFRNSKERQLADSIEAGSARHQRQSPLSSALYEKVIFILILIRAYLQTLTRIFARKQFLFPSNECSNTASPPLKRSRKGQKLQRTLWKA